ncbi:MAG TPA: ATP-binding protein [Solirubrobacteraceae bacterium]|jgi:DNA replication protein DnaC|nr:ATP-binding protein [Solirubrobacteraceae bacterium]
MNADVVELGGLRGPGACPFDLCDGSGFVVEEETNTASDCRCRAQRIARSRASALEARIPNRYRASTFEQLEGDSLSAFSAQVSIVRRFVKRISQNVDEGNSMWIMGDIGTGKTALAMLVSKAALQAGKTVAIYSLPRLLSLIRESIEHEEGVVGFLERLSAVDLLHIDDVGAENRTDWALEQLYTIVNTRYEERRAIVLTTNLTHGELAEQVGERIVSRLVEMCGDTVVPLYGHDRRRQPPEEASARALA